MLHTIRTLESPAFVDFQYQYSKIYNIKQLTDIQKKVAKNQSLLFILEKYLQEYKLRLELTLMCGRMYLLTAAFVGSIFALCCHSPVGPGLGA